MWLPRPMTQRSPIRTTGSDAITWPGAIPAVRQACGPTIVPSPIRMYRSLYVAPCGNVSTLPRPNAPNRRPSGSSGPIAPTWPAHVHPHWTAAWASRRTDLGRDRATVK